MKSELKKWKTISSKSLLDHQRLKVVEDTVELPDGRLSDYVRHAPSHTESVAIIAVNTKGEVLVQLEYSHPPAKVMWQLPGGSMEAGETVEEAALRELAEESGYAAKQIVRLGYFYVHNRLSDKRQYIVLCQDLFKKKLQEDADEFIETYWLTMEEVKQKITTNEFDNVNLLAGLNLWFHQPDHKPELN